MSPFTFDVALNRWLRHGRAVAREGWNGKGMFVFLDTPTGLTVATRFPVQPCLFLKTAENTVVAWTPSQSDLLATDWTLVDAGATV